MRKFSLTCLGVGDGWTCPDRNHASFIYRFGKTTLLVDCGEPVDGSRSAHGLNVDAFDSVLISHLHADHIGGFFMLMQGFWLEGRRKDLPVHMPGGAIKPVREMLRTAFIFDELLNFRLKFVPIKAARPFSVRNVHVTPFYTTHLEGFRSRFQKKYRMDFSAFSFLFQARGLRIGHSADIGRPNDLDPILEKPLDLLVCELAHFAPEDLFCYLRGRAIGRVVFIHLARQYWENLAQTRRLAAKMLPDIPHSFARDGSVVGL
jgi:ribonuclease BN (tRNA processing enzyme)